jgi:hypothetical protein
MVQLTENQREIADLVKLLRKAEDAIDIKDREKAKLQFNIAFQGFRKSYWEIRNKREAENREYIWGNELWGATEKVYIEFQTKHIWSRQQLVA